MTGRLDRAFNSDALSINDELLIFGGSTSPVTTAEVAPIGSLYLQTNGNIWFKTGVNDTDWTSIPISDSKVTVSNADSVPGTLSAKLSPSSNFSYGIINNGANEQYTLNLSTTGISAGTYKSVYVDAYGRVTAGSNPSTLAGYGIVDAQGLNAALTAISNLTTPGLLTLTSTGNVTNRSLASTTLTISNASGVAGNPTVELSTIGTPVTDSFVKITTDTYGRVTATAAPNAANIVTALGFTPVNIAGDTMTGLLTLSGDPTQALHAATKQYVDNAITGLDMKQSVRVATTANITLSGTQIIDGIAVVAGNRVLVKNQTTTSQNGIYEVAAGAWTRATDADNSGNGAEVSANMYCFVEEGTTNADSGWVLTTNNPITLDTTGLTFTQFTGTGQITAGAGLTKTGNILDVGTAAVGRIVVNADNIDLATTGVTAGTYNTITVDAYGRATTGSNTAYLTGNQTITLSGDVTGSGTTAITATLATIGAGGTGVKITYNAKGLVTGTSALIASDIPALDWSKITTGLPTTLAGYGITNAVTNAGGSPSIQQGLLADMPAAETAGRLYYATDGFAWYRDNGTTWDLALPALYGDISSSAGSNVTTLASVGTPGTYNNVTTDVKGRVVSGSNVSYLTANQSISVTGDATGSGTTSIPLTLATVNSNVGNFGGSTSVPVITVNGKGLITTVSSQAISFPVTSVSGKTGAVTLTSTDVGLNNVSNALQVINAGNTPSISAGTFASRPIAGAIGRLYFATDVFSIFRDNGTTWDIYQPAISGDITISAGNTIAALANVGTAGTYTKVTTDAKGRVTSGTNLTQADITTYLGYTPVNIAGDTMTGPLILAADPSSALGAATKQYVDNAVSGLIIKDACRAATTTNITLSGTQTIDGIPLVANDRVLVKNQTTASQNGIYVVAAGSWLRAEDANNIGNGNEVKANIFTFISEGSTQADTGWVLTTNNPITLGTTNLTWTQFSGSGSIVGGAGLMLTGTVLDIGTANSGRIVVNADNIDLATTGVTAGTYNNVTVDAYGRVTAASTANYITGNQTITISGDATGSGTTNIGLTLVNSGVTAGTYNTVTVNAKGLVTSATNTSYLTSNQTITLTGDVSGSGTTTIAAVLNTVPINKGGTGATTALSGFNALSPLTTKGDILAHTGVNNVRIPVGTDGQFLKADSANVNGVTWANAITTDQFVKVSATDTTSGYVLTKLVPGIGISLTQNNAGGNETVTISNTVTTGDLPLLQVRTTATIGLSSTPVSVTWNIKDYANSTSVINWTTGTNIIIGQTGYYKITYTIPIAALSATRTITASVRQNGTTTLVGSTMPVTALQNYAPEIAHTFYANLAAADTLALRLVTASSSATAAAGIVMTVTRMTGMVGPSGPQGIQGIDGPTGPTGPQGIPGPAGPAGSGSTINVQNDGSYVLPGSYTALNFVGSAVNAVTNGTNSAIVDVTIDPQISNLGDVALTAVADNDILQFNSTTGKWENTPLGLYSMIGSLFTIDMCAYQTVSNKWLGADDVVANSNAIQHILPWACKLVGWTFSSNTANVGLDLELHRLPWGSGTVSTTLFTWALRNTRIARKTNFTPSLTFNAGDRIAIFAAAVEDQNVPNSVSCILHFMITDDTGGDADINWSGTTIT
ncbi:MAG: hypothetical protein QXN55_01460 [Candidatus Nitrosotenuis sp.]